MFFEIVNRVWFSQEAKTITHSKIEHVKFPSPPGSSSHVMQWKELDAWQDAMNYDTECYDPSDVTQFENEYMLRLKMDGFCSDIKFDIFPTHKGSDIYKVWIDVGYKPERANYYGIHKFTGDKGECLEFVKELIVDDPGTRKA
jgi:hypothetical protein